MTKATATSRRHAESPVDTAQRLRAVCRTGIRPFCLAAALAMTCAAGLPARAQEQPVSHRFLKSGCGSQSVAIVGRDGRIEWEYRVADETSDAWLLPGGNVIFAYKHGVREVTPDQKTAWEFPAPEGAEIHSCQPLPGELFLIGEAHADGTANLYELDRTGRKAKTIPINGGGGAHSQFRQVRKTPQGTYLVTYQRDGGQAKEYDGEGKLLRTFCAGRFVAIRLPNGNTLIACGDEHRVIEVDPQDGIVWEVKEKDMPGNVLGFAAGLQRLPNGNTVICNWSGHGGAKDQPQVFELTRDKKVVWEVRDPRLNMISSINILDAPGDVLKGEILR